MKIFVLQTYTFNTYSYTGTGIAEVHYFTTSEKANNFASNNNYEIVSIDIAYDFDNPEKICTIEEVKVL